MGRAREGDSHSSVNHAATGYRGVKASLGPTLPGCMDHRKPDCERSFLGCPIPQSRDVGPGGPDGGARPSLCGMGV